MNELDDSLKKSFSICSAKTRMCEFHARASEFLARRRRLFVGSLRTGEVRRKTINRLYK